MILTSAATFKPSVQPSLNLTFQYTDMCGAQSCLNITAKLIPQNTQSKMIILRNMHTARDSIVHLFSNWLVETMPLKCLFLNRPASRTVTNKALILKRPGPRHLLPTVRADWATFCRHKQAQTPHSSPFPFSLTIHLARVTQLRARQQQEVLQA